MPADDIAAKLRELGERRVALNEAMQKLADDTRDVVKVARAFGVPMTEVSSLVGLERTTLYQVYVR